MGDQLDTIVGQDTAKRFVRTAVKKGNLYNFLLVGPRGVGKRIFAFSLAHMLGCTMQTSHFMLVAPIPPNLRDKPEKIQEYLQLYAPDNPVIDLEDKSTIIVGQIRAIIARLMHLPTLGTRHVVLMLEADRMNEEAANCFLKTLEEPPTDTFFILTSSRPDHLLPTIISRCRRIPFSYLSNSQMQDITLEGGDPFLLGSPGESMILDQSEVIDEASNVLRQCPLSIQAASLLAKEYRKRSLVELLYPLMLLYRRVLYEKLGVIPAAQDIKDITRKAEKIEISNAIHAIALLNDAINSLAQSPNRLLLLLNIFLQLP